MVPNERGSSQGCVPATKAVLGFAYDLAVAFCVSAPNLCAMPAPLSTVPPTYSCGCNCTYASNACCTSPDGVVHESLLEIQQLTALSGSCCNQWTGRFEARKEGENQLNPDDGDMQACGRSHAPKIGLNGLGFIQTSRRRGRRSASLW